MATLFSSRPSLLDAVGVGSPIMDTLAWVPEAFLQNVPGAKGGMELVDAAEMERLLGLLAGQRLISAPGGSAGNTIATLARLGARCAFLGKTGDDATAEAYRRLFASYGVDTHRFKRGPGPNARCLSLVTPDAERTLRTCLGAAATWQPTEMSAADFEGARLAHIEGYLLFNPPLAHAVLHAAKAAGCRISLDLASFEVVRASRGILPGILADYVDIVLANEDEAAAFWGDQRPLAEAAQAFAQLCPVAVVKCGARGAIVVQGDTTVPVAPVHVPKPVDTTGAGDLWAAGFLYGLLRGWPLERAGALASRLGAEVVQIMGADLPEATLSRLRDDLGRTQAAV